MQGVNRQYTREMREYFGYSATWLPTTVVALGDVGRLKDYEYQRMGSLADFGIAFEAGGGTPRGLYSYSSADSVDVEVKLAGAVPSAGSALAQADAGVRLSFGSGSATFFQADQCSSHEIRNKFAVEAAVVALAEQGRWKKDYVVVTEVIEAKSATIIISSSENAMIELKADAAVNLAAANLADASIGFQITRSRNIGTQLIAQGGLTPLFKAEGLKRRLFKKADELIQREVHRDGIAEARSGSDWVVRELDYNDF